MINILYCLQARSGSKRLPGKSLAMIEDAIMVDHCIQACKQSASYINFKKDKIGISANIATLIPYDDPLKHEIAGSSFLIEGPEEDVLARFKIASQLHHPDYFVRLTGDCPLIPPTIITKHVMSAIFKKLDYCSNSYDEMRTFPDGYDCEVISKQLMDWIFQNAKTKEEKEHVTILAKTHPPTWAKYGVIFGNNDFSDIKISVDTKEELERVRANKAAMTEKVEIAKRRKFEIFKF